MEFVRHSRYKRIAFFREFPWIVGILEHIGYPTIIDRGSDELQSPVDFIDQCWVQRVDEALMNKTPSIVRHTTQISRAISPIVPDLPMTKVNNTGKCFHEDREMILLIKYDEHEGKILISPKVAYEDIDPETGKNRDVGDLGFGERVGEAVCRLDDPDEVDYILRFNYCYRSTPLLRFSRVILYKPSRRWKFSGWIQAVVEDSTDLIKSVCQEIDDSDPDYLGAG